MAFSLKNHKDLIIELWNNQRLSEEEIASYLQEKNGIATTFYEVRAYLEQWNLIPAPSPTYSHLEDPITSPRHEEWQPNYPQASSSQQTNHYQQNSSYQGPYYQETSMPLDSLNTGPTPLEMYAQDFQPHEHLAVSLSSPGRSTPKRSHRSKKGDKGEKKRGPRGSEAARKDKDSRGKAGGGSGVGGGTGERRSK